MPNKVNLMRTTASSSAGKTEIKMVADKANRDKTINEKV